MLAFLIFSVTLLFSLKILSMRGDRPRVSYFYKQDQKNGAEGRGKMYGRWGFGSFYDRWLMWRGFYFLKLRCSFSKHVGHFCQGCPQHHPCPIPSSVCKGNHWEKQYPWSQLGPRSPSSSQLMCPMDSQTDSNCAYPSQGALGNIDCREPEGKFMVDSRVWF